jgi:hypothetical protein
MCKDFDSVTPPPPHIYRSCAYFVKEKELFFSFLKNERYNLKQLFLFLLDLRVQSIDFFLILALSRASRAWFVLHQHL